MRNSICVVAIAVSLVWVSVPATAATKVFLIGGQSNAAGTGTAADLPASYNVPQPDVRFWNYSNNGWIDLQPGLGDTSNDIGPEVGFGYTLNNLFPGDDVYLIKLDAGRIRCV